MFNFVLCRTILRIIETFYLFYLIHQVTSQTERIGKLDCTYDWKVQIHYSVLLNQSVIINLYMLTADQCPFAIYEVTIIKVYYPDYKNRCLVPYDKINEPIYFYKLKLGTYYIEVLPLSKSITGEELCFMEGDNVCVVLRSNAFFRIDWQTDIDISKFPQVSFRLSPELGFYKYEILLYKLSDSISFDETSISNNTVVEPSNCTLFSDMSSGKYGLAIVPYEYNSNGQCLCGIDIQKMLCLKCKPFKYSELIEVKDSENISWKIATTATFCSILLVFIIIIGFVFYRKKFPQVTIIVPQHEDYYINALYNQNILLIHADDFRGHENAVHVLGSILQLYCKSSVTIFPSLEHPVEILQNRFQWMENQLLNADKIVLVLSLKLTNCFDVSWPTKDSLIDDMKFHLLNHLKFLISTKKNLHQKLILCYFNYSLSHFNISALQTDHCYELPSALESLILHITNLSVHKQNNEIHLSCSHVEELTNAILSTEQ